MLSKPYRRWRKTRNMNDTTTEIAPSPEFRLTGWSRAAMRREVFLVQAGGEQIDVTVVRMQDLYSWIRYISGAVDSITQVFRSLSVLEVRARLCRWNCAGTSVGRISFQKVLQRCASVDTYMTRPRVTNVPMRSDAVVAQARNGCCQARASTMQPTDVITKKMP